MNLHVAGVVFWGPQNDATSEGSGFLAVISKPAGTHLRHEKNLALLSMSHPGCLIGILVMVYHNPQQIPDQQPGFSSLLM